MTRYTKSPDAIARLTPEQFRVTQQSGTERPGSGARPRIVSIDELLKASSSVRLSTRANQVVSAPARRLFQVIHRFNIVYDGVATSVDGTRSCSAA